MAGFKVGLGSNASTGTRGLWLAWALIHPITCWRRIERYRYFGLANEDMRSMFEEVRLAVQTRSSDCFLRYHSS